MVFSVVSQILGFGTAGSDLEVLRRRSSNPDALLADIQGRRCMERWRLTDAERAFRQAVALDTTFAMALHHLATTLYWEVVEGTRRASATKPEIAQFSTAAVRHAANGLPADTLLIFAFQHMQDGDFADFARARSLLGGLLRRDSTNAYARLMLASIEVEDRWLERKSDGSLAPRANLNVAERTFTDLLRRQSGFDLGYGHLGHIYREVAGAVRGGGCSGFDRPRDDLLVGWDRRTPHEMLSFCPVPLDSLVWIPRETFTAISRPTAEERLQRLVSKWTRLLHWWESTSPRASQPRKELAWIALDARTHLGAAPAEAADSFARVALQYTSEAMVIEGDTLPQSLIWLGALYLGAGRLDSALALTERGLRLIQEAGEPPPAYAANVFLATGQPTRALPIAEAIVREFFLPDPDDGHLIPSGGAERYVRRAVVLGATGVGGVALQNELDVMLRLWTGPSYSSRDRLLLRKDALEGLAIPFSLDQSALRSWIDGIESPGALWQALQSSHRDPGAARDFLAEVASGSGIGFSESYDAFLLARVATIAGDHAGAIQHYTRLDSVPLGLDRMDSAWGFRALSYLLRAEEYAADGQIAPAREYYRRFIDAWESVDSLTLPLLERARERAR
jgi:tetratricopeptide (TPR) repeat protein